MIEMTLRKEQIQVFKVTGIHVLGRIFRRRGFLEINSDLISFRIRLVNLICEHLVTLLHLELKSLMESKPEIVELRLQSWMNSELHCPVTEQIQMYQWMEEVEVAETKKTLILLKYLEHQIRLLEEVEVVAVKVETQEEFSVR
ncbi:hypothetical protein Tco_0314204, partial [Tanacetum coccineum]